MTIMIVTRIVRENSLPPPALLAKLMRNHIPTRLCACILGTLFSIAENVAQEPDKKPAPALLLRPFSSPIHWHSALVSKAKSSCVDELEQVSEVSANPESIKVKLKKAEKSNPTDDFKAEQVGNSRVEVEVQLDKALKTDQIKLSLQSPQQTLDHAILLITSDQLVTEVEPNPGFRQSQSIKTGQTYKGQSLPPKMLMSINSNSPLLNQSGSKHWRLDVVRLSIHM